MLGQTLTLIIKTCFFSLDFSAWQLFGVEENEESAQSNDLRMLFDEKLNLQFGTRSIFNAQNGTVSLSINSSLSNVSEIKYFQSSYLNSTRCLGWYYSVPNKVDLFPKCMSVFADKIDDVILDRFLMTNDTFVLSEC